MEVTHTHTLTACTEADIVHLPLCQRSLDFLHLFGTFAQTSESSDKEVYICITYIVYTLKFISHLSKKYKTTWSKVKLELLKL